MHFVVLRLARLYLLSSMRAASLWSSLHFFKVLRSRSFCTVSFLISFRPPECCFTIPTFFVLCRKSFSDKGFRGFGVGIDGCSRLPCLAFLVASNSLSGASCLKEVLCDCRCSGCCSSGGDDGGSGSSRSRLVN